MENEKMNPKTVRASVLQQQHKARKARFEFKKRFGESPDFRAAAIQLAESMMKKEKE
jgi:hypothetical protein